MHANTIHVWHVKYVDSKGQCSASDPQSGTRRRAKHDIQLTLAAQTLSHIKCCRDSVMTT